MMNYPAGEIPNHAGQQFCLPLKRFKPLKRGGDPVRGIAVADPLLKGRARHIAFIY